MQGLSQGWPGLAHGQSLPTGHVLGSGLTATCPCRPGAPMDPHHLTWGFMGCTAGPTGPARSWHFTHALNRVRGRSSRGHRTLCGDLAACPHILWSCPYSGGQAFLLRSSGRAPCQGQWTLGDVRGWPATFWTLRSKRAERLGRRSCRGGGQGWLVGGSPRRTLPRCLRSRGRLARPSPPLTRLPPCARLPSYGRVYAAADPYHHTIGPAATYSIGTMVRRRGRPGPGHRLWRGGPGAAAREGWAGPESDPAR